MKSLVLSNKHQFMALVLYVYCKHISKTLYIYFRPNSWQMSAFEYCICFLKGSNKTFHIHLWRKKIAFEVPFLQHTQWQIRAHKSWHYFILLCASVKEQRYHTAPKNCRLCNSETWQHFIPFIFWLYIYQGTCISSSSAGNRRDWSAERHAEKKIYIFYYLDHLTF